MNRKFLFSPSHFLRRVLYAVAALAVVLIVGIIGFRMARKDEVRRILVVHSYSPEFDRAALYDELIRAEFAHKRIDPDIRNVFMAAQRDGAGRHLRLFVLPELDTLRMQGWEPEAIIVNDDCAYANTLDSLRERYPYVPIVYGGVNYPQIRQDFLDTDERITGFRDSIDFAANFRFFRRYASCGICTVELDYTPLDSFLRADILRTIAADTVNFVDNTDFSHSLNSDWCADSCNHTFIFTPISCANVDSNEHHIGPDHDRVLTGGAVLFGIYRNAKYYEQLNVKADVFSSMIIDRNIRPQFSAVNDGFSNREETRFFAGYFPSLKTQVADEVDYVTKIFNGVPISQLPRATHHADYCYNYNALSSYGVDYYKLRRSEPDAFIVNVPWYVNHAYTAIFLGLLALIAASALIGGLTWLAISYINRRSRRLLKQLTTEDQNVRLALEGSEALFWTFADGVITFTGEYLLQLTNRTVVPYTIDQMLERTHPSSISTVKRWLRFEEKPGHYTIRVLFSSFLNKTQYLWWEVSYYIHDDFDVSSLGGVGRNHEKGHYEGIVFNIENLKRSEEELIYAREKVAEVKQKHSFLANMTHDLRAPLNAIVGFSQLLAEMQQDCTPEEIREYTELIRANGNVMLTLVGDVVENSNSAQKGITVKLAPVGVAELVELAWQNNKIICPEHLHLFLERGERGLTIEADHERVQQILNNYLGNAFKFPPAGSVTVGWKYHAELGEVELFVQDTGIGIPEDKQDRLFSQFYKTDDNHQGTGLGLSICKFIATEHHGRVSCHSVVGEGSRFSFWIKATKDAG